MLLQATDDSRTQCPPQQNETSKHTTFLWCCVCQNSCRLFLFVILFKTITRIRGYMKMVILIRELARPRNSYLSLNTEDNVRGNEFSPTVQPLPRKVQAVKMMSVMKLVDSGSRHGHNLCISWWSALWNPSVGHHPLPQTQRQTPDIYIHFGSRKNNCLEHM